jgi:hypothetical protein
MAILFVAVCLLVVSFTLAEEADQSAIHALLINGGSQPALNYQSHLHHLQDMVALLERRGISRERIHVLSADGDDDAKDLAVRDSQTSGFWLLEGTRIGGLLQPRTEIANTRWEGMTLLPASRAAVKDWFERSEEILAPGDRLLIFVTDHGTGNDEDPNNGSISLWGEILTVRELKWLVSRLPSAVQAVMVMSQCYSGTFADAMYEEGATEPSGDVCGFFSTARDLLAYGCFPEGRDRDRVGHAFRFIDALERHDTTAEAHLEVLVTDGTPDAPLRTSDVYLERLLVEEAEARGLEADALIDRLLTEAWTDPAAWEPKIRLLDRIGLAFGIFSPRSLAELGPYESELPALIEQMTTYAERWSPTLVNVKEENLRSFVSERPDWRERLQARTIEPLDVEGRRELLEQLLRELEQYTRDRPEMLHKLENLSDRFRKTSQIEWRLEVRAAGIRRLRSVLTGIAGRVLLETETDSTEPAIDLGERRTSQRRALQRLEQCESFAPGVLEARSSATDRRSVEPFPKLEDDLLLIEEVLPSWLGVRFGTVPDALVANREFSAGARFLEAIYSDSPAQAAGLEVGERRCRYACSVRAPGSTGTCTSTRCSGCAPSPSRRRSSRLPRRWAMPRRLCH